MRDLANRVAVVTGAASGIGLALAERFAAEGMKLVLADIEEPALRAANDKLSDQGATTLAVPTDVSLWDDVQALADAACERFGAVHVLCNNAGVAGEGGGGVGIWNRTVLDWQWLLGVNLFGVIHGIHAFVPRMIASAEEGHVVNTASVAGITDANDMYGVSKHAVIALSQALLGQLRQAKAKVGVSVVCPGLIETQIGSSARNRPERLKNDGGSALPSRAQPPAVTPMAPLVVAESVVNAIQQDSFYAVPVQEEWRNGIASILERRNEAIVAAMNRSDVTP